MKLFTGNGIKNNKIKNPKLQIFRYFLTIAVIAIPLLTTGCLKSSGSTSGSSSSSRNSDSSSNSDSGASSSGASSSGASSSGASSSGASSSGASSSGASSSGASSSGASSSGGGVTAPTLSYASSSGKTIASGANFSVTPSTFTTGGGSVTCAATSGHSLPTGFSVNNSCVISATSPAVGSYSLYITATNSAGHADSGLVTLTVQLSAPNITFVGQQVQFNDYNDNWNDMLTVHSGTHVINGDGSDYNVYRSSNFGFNFNASTTNSGGAIVSCALSSSDLNANYVNPDYTDPHVPYVSVVSGECSVVGYVLSPVGNVDGNTRICVTATNAGGTSTEACFQFKFSNG